MGGQEASASDGGAGRSGFVGQDGTARPDQRFAKAHRIRARQDFTRVQAAPGFKLRGDSFVMLVSRRVDAGPTRMGPVASRRVGNSVVRSRAKRLLRELFRLHRDHFGSGVDVVLIAQPGLEKLGLAALEKQLEKLRPLLQKRLRSLPASPDRLASSPDRRHDVPEVSR